MDDFQETTMIATPDMPGTHPKPTLRDPSIELRV